ncbi:MAG TPA: transcriptional regulator, partial [Trebonia sp.]
MTDDAYGATVAKRRLSLRLADLRGTTGYTANHVCDILNWGRGKVGRFEANQWKRPEMSDIR